MKRTIAILLAVLICVGFASCASEPESAVTSETVVTNNSTNIYDFQFVAFDISNTLPCELDDFMRRVHFVDDSSWDQELDYNETFTCDVSYLAETLTITIYNPYDDIREIDKCLVGKVEWDFYASDSNSHLEIGLANGLTVNKDTTAEDIEAAFGTPSDRSDGQGSQIIKYTQDAGGNAADSGYMFEFDASNKTISEVVMSNMLAAPNPDYIEEYQAPAALTDDYEDMSFRLDGVLYQLPTPVKEFENNGWSLVTNETEPSQIESGSESNLIPGYQLVKGNTKLTVILKNFSNTSVNPEDTVVFDISMTDETLNGMDFELSGDLSFDMPKSDLEKIIEEKGYGESFYMQDAENSGYLTENETVYTRINESRYIEIKFNKNTVTNISFSENKIEGHW